MRKIGRFIFAAIVLFPLYIFNILYVIYYVTEEYVRDVKNVN